MNSSRPGRGPSLGNMVVRLQGWFFVLAAAFIAHSLFSWIGFNPTDDGYTLATSRRILLGEVPFRDFILIRPPGSFLLHIPWLLFGGDSVLYVSRLGAWFQFAVIAWCWVLIVERMAGMNWGAWRRMAMGVTAFCLSVHTFPIMVWHSVDALFFASLGMALAGGALPGGKVPGYFLLGCAVMCRQNFAPVALGCILLLGDWRRARFWLAGAAPAFAVAGWIWKQGALAEAVGQLSAYSDPILVGVQVYFYDYTSFVGVQIGYWTFALMGRKLLAGPGTRNKGLLQAGTAVLLLFPAAAALGLNCGGCYHELSRLLFCSACGVLLASLVELADGWMTAWAGILAGAFIGVMRFGGLNPYLEMSVAVMGAVVAWWLLVGRLPRIPGEWTWRKAGFLAVLTAWSVSISLGYATPALMSGPLAVFLVAVSVSILEGNRWFGISKAVRSAAFAFLALAAAASFWAARHRIVYRDRPARELKVDLGGILAGARGIRTNTDTAAFLRDLRKAVAWAKGAEYCVIPDLACHWVASARRNPLPVDWADWAHTADAGTPSMLLKSISAIEKKRPKMLVIVQRVRADDIATGFTVLSDDSQFPLVRFVRGNLTPVWRTEYFDLYR